MVKKASLDCVQSSLQPAKRSTAGGVFRGRPAGRGSPYTNACALESHFPRGARPPARQDVRVLHAYQNGEQVSRTVLYDR